MLLEQCLWCGRVELTKVIKAEEKGKVKRDCPFWPEAVQACLTFALGVARQNLGWVQHVVELDLHA
jgi:hypothetical protein